ncbi:MAG: M24 family metallopeptidase, partial [Salinigranum sp.]
AAAGAAARASSILAEATADAADALRWEGEVLTGERLRREANATLARAGVSDAGNTAVRVGGPRAEGGEFRAADAPIRPGETVAVDLAPRGPKGYHAALSRTFVVDGDGGWERRAHVACESALRVGRSEIEPGASASRVRGEVAAEVAAYGFEMDRGNRSGGERREGGGEEDERGEVGRRGGGIADATVHGVGLSRCEPPSGRAGGTLREGAVVVMRASVSGPEGEIRLADAVAVTAEGCEVLAEAPRRLTPEA